MRVEEFIDILEKNGNLTSRDISEIKENWKPAEDASRVVGAFMPGIGFLSVQQRLNAFFAVCRHFDKLVEEHTLSEDQCQLSINILRLTNKKFSKAIAMFELRANRFDAKARADMPVSARQYLAGMNYVGY